VGALLGWLDPRDLCSLLSFWTFADFKAHLVSLAEVFEAYIDKFVGMEKEIFCHAFYFDEAEALIRETSDDSLLHTCKSSAPDNYQVQEAEKETIDSYFLFRQHCV
jgi:hypothetical protein